MASLAGRAALALLLLAVGGRAGSGAGAQVAARDEPKQDLHPPLRPGDFHRDYIHDRQPPASKHFKFDHPYPEVQDSDTYDKDFPKDENHDDGEWHAQMEYDEARNLLTKKENAERRALAARDAMERELAHARKELAHAEGESKRAQQAVLRVRSQADSDDSDEEGEPSGLEGMSIEEAMAEVERRTNALPGCEEQLAEAKAKLEKLLQGRDEHEIERVHEALEAKNDVWRAAKALRKAEEAQKKLTERKGKLQESLVQEEEKLAAATKNYEEQAALERKAEEEFQEAKNRLRRFRKVPEELPPDEQPHYLRSDAELEVEEQAQEQAAHSGAARPGPLALFSAVLVAPLATLAVMSA